MADETLKREQVLAEDAGHRTAWIRSLLCLVLGIAALLFVFREPASAMLAVWRSSPSFEHGFLIIILAIVVAISRHRSLRLLVPRPWYWGLIIAVLASGIAISGEAASVMVVQQLAMIALFQILVLTVLGPEVSRRLLFPLLYLYFAVPVGDVIVPAMQDFTAHWTVATLSLLGITATVDGFLIRLPNADFRVAEACAGLRFFLVGFATSLLIASVFLHSWPRRIIFLVIAIVVPLIGNTLRAASHIIFAEQGIMDIPGTSCTLASLEKIRASSTGSSPRRSKRSFRNSSRVMPGAFTGTTRAAWKRC